MSIYPGVEDSSRKQLISLKHESLVFRTNFRRFINLPLALMLLDDIKNPTAIEDEINYIRSQGLETGPLGGTVDDIYAAANVGDEYAQGVLIHQGLLAAEGVATGELGTKETSIKFWNEIALPHIRSEEKAHDFGLHDIDESLKILAGCALMMEMNAEVANEGLPTEE